MDAEGTSQKERLKMSVNLPASCAACALITQTGIPAGPDGLRVLTRWSILCTLASGTGCIGDVAEHKTQVFQNLTVKLLM